MLAEQRVQERQQLFWDVAHARVKEQKLQPHHSVQVFVHVRTLAATTPLLSLA